MTSLYGLPGHKTHISSLQDITYRCSVGGGAQQLQVETLQNKWERCANKTTAAGTTSSTTRLGAEAQLPHTGEEGEAVSQMKFCQMRNFKLTSDLVNKKHD